jgi:hypothetical protein
MNRWTAKVLLLVLLAGICAPMAASMSMPADHCVRKPLAAPMPAKPGCHHHEHATATQPSSTSLTLRSKQCCEGHECCRSMVRSHSAQVGPRTIFKQIDRAERYVSAQPAQFVRLAAVSYQFDRGPPSL